MKNSLTMKIFKTFYTLIFLQLLFAGGLFGQSISITPFGGYTFADKTDIPGGRAKLGDGFTYGGWLTFGLTETYELELMYSRQDADGSYSYSNYYDSDPLAVNYILIGGNRLFPVSPNVTLFSGLKLGASIIGSKDDYFDNITKFAVNIEGGMKYFINDKIGLRLQADLGMPMVHMQGDLWWSLGSGPDAGVSGSSPFLQFGFKGGIIYRIK